MNDLDQLPYLRAFGEQLDELAERDARRGLRSRLESFGHARSRPASHRGRGFAPGLRAATTVVAAIVIASGVYAVPATRAAVDSVFSTFTGWFSGDAATTPGRPVVAGEVVPSWVAGQDGEKRVLAQAAGQKLLAIRQGEKLTFALADFGTTDTIDGWARTVGNPGIVIVGPGRFLPGGRHDLRPLFGLVSAAVTRIQLDYADGGSPVSQVGLHGAFGIVIEANRRPKSLTGYDDMNRRVAHLDLITDPRDLSPGETLADFRYCPDAVKGCPPWPK